MKVQHPMYLKKPGTQRQRHCLSSARWLIFNEETGSNLAYGVINPDIQNM